MTKITFSKFYNYDELTEFLNDAVDSAPDIVSLTSLAKTPEGRDIWCVEVGVRPNTLNRPGYLVVANLHSIELAGSMTSLYLIRHLINGYTKNSNIKTLLHEQVFYIVPRLAVDGAEYVLSTFRNVRSKFVDIKEKNVIFPEDIDGNQKILSMRWQSPNGKYKLSKKDPRIVIPRDPWDYNEDGPFYHLFPEGLIHDWDGENIETSNIWPDFNRDFPANWKPMPEVIGHGANPLSHAETKGLANFVRSHPNIINAVDLHTGNVAVLLPTSTIREIALHEEDANYFHALGKKAQKITGFPLLGGYDEIRMGPPAEGLPGTFKDWLYEDMAICPFIIEMGVFHNYIGISTEEYYSFDLISHREEKIGRTLLRWHDRHPKHELFFDWKPYSHPQFGEVEIGGWNWLLRSNPPISKLMDVCHKCVTFILEHALNVPKVQISHLKIKEIETSIFELLAEIKNKGKVPTNITKQGLKKEPYLNVKLNCQEALTFIEGEKQSKIPHLAPINGNHQLKWVFSAPYNSWLSVEVSSTRGVYVTETIELLPFDGLA